MQTYRVLHIRTDRHANTHTHRRTDAQTQRRTDAHTHRRTDAQTHRRTDAQTHRRTDAHARTLRQSTGFTNAFECYFACVRLTRYLVPTTDHTRGAVCSGESCIMWVCLTRKSECMHDCPRGRRHSARSVTCQPHQTASRQK